MSTKTKKAASTAPRALPSLDAVEVVALSRAIAEKEAKQAVELGLAEGTGPVAVDFTVRVTGTVERGLPSERKATSKLLSKAALALVLQRCGVTGPAAVELLADCLKAAVDADESLQEQLEGEVRLAFERVEAAIGTTTIKVAGSVKAKVVVERL